MAKDTEKLIRQLSLISFLMAERRPVTALEIRRDVEGYSGMNEDAFARRFYADRAELDQLGIHLTVERAGDGNNEQEHYSLRSEDFHLPPIAFTDDELASLRVALNLLDGEFAYAEPLRLALQQLTWGRPNPLEEPGVQTVGLGVTANVDGHELSQHLAKVETAIFRCKTITFEYHSISRDVVESRKVDPYHLLFRAGQFYLVARDHQRGDQRLFRLSRMRGRVSFASKAEHDFRRPDDFDPRAYGERAEWQMADEIGTARIRIAERIAWQVQRTHGAQGTITPYRDAAAGDGDAVLETGYGVPRALLGWVLRLGEHAEILEPADLVELHDARVALLAERHEGEFATAAVVPRAAEPHPEPPKAVPRDGIIRPERFARLATLASILIHAGREGRTLPLAELLERLGVTEAELRDDLGVLNVVNFGGGSYVLYAEINDDGEVEVDPEPYSDHFARPARLLPVEAKALVAAIDLLGDHLPGEALPSARQKIVDALGEDPRDRGLQVVHGGADDRDLVRALSGAIADRHEVRLRYWKPNEDELGDRRLEPYALINGREGWYVAGYDLDREAVRHFRLDRVQEAEVLEQSFERRPEVDPVAEVGGWPRTGELPASRSARVWISPERARWEREKRTVADELEDGALVVEVPFAGLDWLVREVLTEAGDLVVLEPADAREAVRDAVRRLGERVAR